MTFLFIAFIFLFAMFTIGIGMSILIMYILYRLTGGKKSFGQWYKYMDF